MAIFVAIVLLIVSFASAYISDTYVSKMKMESVRSLLFGVMIFSFVGAVFIIFLAFISSFS